MAETWEGIGVDVRGRSSGNVKTRCPRCSHLRKKPNDPCLSADVSDGVWLCHNCGWSGSLTGGTEQAGGRYGARLSAAERPRRAYAPPPPIPAEDGLTPEVLARFAKRGIPEAVVRRNRITAGPEPMPQLDGRRAVCIRYPYFRDGALVNTKYRAHPKHFKMAAGAELVFFGLDDCADADQVTICEGEDDALACEAAGVTARLSVPNGAAPGRSPDLAYVDSGAAIFGRCHSVVLATDGDAPGEELAEELSRRIGREKCYRVVWPEGCKDANDVLVARGPDALRAVLAEARAYPVEGMVDHDDLFAAVWRIYDHGSPRGVSTGWHNLDGIYTVRPGQLTVVTGVPSSGKSIFLNAMLVNLAREQDWAFGVFSPEYFPLEEMVRDLIKLRSGRPFDDGPTPRMDRAEVAEGQEWVRRHFHFAAPDEPTVARLLEVAEVQVFRHGIRGMVIDPWTEVEQTRDRGTTETEFINQSLSKIRRFARTKDVHVWVVAHPTKLTKLDDGTYPVVTPYDISGSAHWFNKADNCLSVWRDRADDSAPVALYTQKIRFRNIGRLGKALLRYDPVTGRYRDAEPTATGGAR